MQSVISFGISGPVSAVVKEKKQYRNFSLGDFRESFSLYAGILQLTE